MYPACLQVFQLRQSFKTHVLHIWQRTVTSIFRLVSDPIPALQSLYGVMIHSWDYRQLSFRVSHHREETTQIHTKYLDIPGSSGSNFINRRWTSQFVLTYQAFGLVRVLSSHQLHTKLVTADGVISSFLAKTFFPQ
jgi:hypothetical protein